MAEKEGGKSGKAKFETTRVQLTDPLYWDNAPAKT